MNRRDKPRGRWAPVILGSILTSFVILCVYVLSIRPVCWLMLHGYIPATVYGAIYWPLFWLGERWKVFGDLLVDYLLNF
jgi:hypothetical protein